MSGIFATELARKVNDMNKEGSIAKIAAIQESFAALTHPPAEVEPSGLAQPMAAKAPDALMRLDALENELRELKLRVAALKSS